MPVTSRKKRARQPLKPKHNTDHISSDSDYSDNLSDTEDQSSNSISGHPSDPFSVSDPAAIRLQKAQELLQDTINSVKSSTSKAVDSFFESDDETSSADSTSQTVSQVLQDRIKKSSGYFSQSIPITMTIQSNPQLFLNTSFTPIFKPSPTSSIRGHLTPVTSFCFKINSSGSPTTAYIANKSNKISSWDLESGTKHKLTPKNSKNAHSDHILSIRYAPKEDIIATAGRDQKIILWDTRVPDSIATLLGHTKAVNSLQFRQNSTTLYSASDDMTVRIWDLRTRGLVDTFFGHQASVSAVDGYIRDVALSCSEDHSVRLWNVSSRKALIFRSQPTHGGLSSVSFLNQNTWVTGSDYGVLSLWSSKKKKPLATVANAHQFDHYLLTDSNVETNLNFSAIKSLTGLSITKENYTQFYQRDLEQDPSLNFPITTTGRLEGTDVFFSASCTGLVRFWQVDTDECTIKPLFACHLAGFISEAQLIDKKLYCLLSTEHPRGRWWKVKSAKNGLYIFDLSALL